VHYGNLLSQAPLHCRQKLTTSSPKLLFLKDAQTAKLCLWGVLSNNSCARSSMVGEDSIIGSALANDTISAD
jgi:hypothetical protein